MKLFQRLLDEQAMKIVKGVDLKIYNQLQNEKNGKIVIGNWGSEK